LLIFDEIQSGLGRTGRYFYFEKYGIRPDVITLAKPLGVGLPLGSVLTSQSISSTFGPGDHGTTFGGGPLACRLGFEFIKILQEEGFLAKIREKGEFFKQKLVALQEKYPFVVDVRGEGLMLAIEVNFPAREIVNQCLRAGFIINVTANTVLRFLPPYIISKKEISRFVKALDKIFSQVPADQ
jgi:acetylornithine aminotransferase/acetylornithine/N-succinyldiaminopimelate aminotransferase